MSRGERNGLIIHDEWIGAFLMFGVVGLVLFILALCDPEMPRAVIPISLAVFLTTAALRRRTEIDRKAGRLRVLWGFGLSPNQPMLRLRVAAKRPISDFFEVLIATVESTGEGGGGFAVSLVYKAPHRRHDFELSSVQLAGYSWFDAAEEAAKLVSADLGLPVRKE